MDSRNLDCGVVLSGHGAPHANRAWALSAERVAAERVAAERVAAERVAAERVVLSGHGAVPTGRVTSVSECRTRSRPQSYSCKHSQSSRVSLRVELRG